METEKHTHITINIGSLIKIWNDKVDVEISDTLKNKIGEAIKEILKDVL